ncbi:hypothetical protein LCGC14_1205310 [marine sediment metagenome]|uniref:Uncharacterized protein n=1 Tax=marine sediment metagenome TaxID=412755 RepID=A0A0F9PKD0_9ZZZZ
MNEQIQEAIDKLLNAQIEEVRVFVDRCSRDKGMSSKEFDQWIKESPKLPSELFLSLLKLVAEDAHLDGRSVYIKNRDISADKIQITCEHPTFEDYWKTLTEQL